MTFSHSRKPESRKGFPNTRWRTACCLLAAMLGSATTLAQAPVHHDSAVEPLPPDTGTKGLQQMLLRLHTTAHFMQTTAHPDDEDGGLLTFESRGKGVSVLLMTLTRGEGGQNKLGSNLFDVLGVVRTLELTAADRYYGIEQRFSRVADFGYSKNPEETFQKWQGHEIPLEDMVRVIRQFRPDVLVARFSGTDRDGHGHHQASSIITQEAFRAAADPNKFPDQVKDGLLPWQSKKLYIGNVCGFGATTCSPENYTVKLNTGENSAALGMSYVQYAINEGLRHQLSQGAGGWTVDPGDRFAFYKLVDSVVESKKDKDGHEADFWDGIDTTVPGLADRLGDEEKKVPWLKGDLQQFDTKIDEATSVGAKDPNAAAAPLLDALRILGGVSGKLRQSSLSAAAKLDLDNRLREKITQTREAVNLALNLKAEAVASVGGSAMSAPELAVVAPGQKLTLELKLVNGSGRPISVDSAHVTVGDVSNTKFVRMNAGYPAMIPVPLGGEPKVIPAFKSFTTSVQVTVPEKIDYTRPYWHRDNPETESLNHIDDSRYLNRPFPPPTFHAVFSYSIVSDKKSSDEPALTNSVSATVLTTVKEDAGERKTALAAGPAPSVMVEPGEQVIPVDDGASRVVKVAVESIAESASGVLRLELPPNWKAEPAQFPVEFKHRGEKKDFQFKLLATSLKEGRAQIRAVLESGGQQYEDGFSVVSREDLDTFYYYQPAIQRVSVVDVKVPKDLKVGYIMGAGDEIPTVLQQIGMNVTLVPAEKLASEDLSKYGTIVLGIRAYDTEKDVAANNKKLLDYVSNGGTLVVQYNASAGDFNAGKFTPYAASLSRARVSVEDAPLEILAPDDGVFHFPNQITQKDFSGWIQERGLYFMDSWDSHFTPLLESHDPGEKAQKGGLLRAQYGKGTYIYTGYAFFRQLPAGVPGAIRLYVNLLSAGHR